MPLKIPTESLDKGQLYSRTRFFIEMGMALAISAMFVLFLGGLRVPASIPIYYLSYRKGPRIALFTAFVLGLLLLIVKPYWLHPIVLIESPLEYMCIAAAGFFPMIKTGSKTTLFQWLYNCRGVILASTLRFIITLIGSYIIYSYYFQSSGPVIWALAFLDEGPIFIPYLIFSIALIPYLVNYNYDIKELK